MFRRTRDIGKKDANDNDNEKHKTNITTTDEAAVNETDDNKSGQGKIKAGLTVKALQGMLASSDDIVFRELYINGRKDLTVTLIFVDGLADQQMISDDIIKPLTQEMVLSNAKSEKEVVDLISHGTLYFSSVKVRHNIRDCINDILSGGAALVFDRAKAAVTFDIRGKEFRDISEPKGENIIKGSKDSFIEVLRINTSLVRRKIKTHNLRIREIVVGRRTQTKVSVIYIEGIANDRIVDEMMRRLNNIDVDGVVTAGYIEEYIIDRKLSLFPQVLYTERVDKFCGSILEGMVGLLVEGLPISYIVPAGLNQFLQAPEDYAENYIVGSMIRFLRYVSVAITLLLPSFYISVMNFHHEMIPTDLALSFASSREDVPFPTFIEVLAMLLAFELLLEAGLRLPKTIGQAVSIVGAIVVGQAAVAARLVSAPVVVIVALTGIAGFTMPNQDFANALRVCRFIMISFASVAGLYGMTMGIFIIVYHLCTMEVFGVPYLSPFVANEGEELMQDTIFRSPLYKMKKRPTGLRTKDKKKQK